MSNYFASIFIDRILRFHFRYKIVCKIWNWQGYIKTKLLLHTTLEPVILRVRQKESDFSFSDFFKHYFQFIYKFLIDILKPNTYYWAFLQEMGNGVSKNSGYLEENRKTVSYLYIIYYSNSFGDAALKSRAIEVSCIVT